MSGSAGTREYCGPRKLFIITVCGLSCSKLLPSSQAKIQFSHTQKKGHKWQVNEQTVAAHLATSRGMRMSPRRVSREWKGAGKLLHQQFRVIRLKSSARASKYGETLISVRREYMYIYIGRRFDSIKHRDSCSISISTVWLDCIVERQFLFVESSYTVVSKGEAGISHAILGIYIPDQSQYQHARLWGN